MSGRSVRYVNQCAARAALEGKILILDGLEKAERNILPILVTLHIHYTLIFYILE